MAGKEYVYVNFNSQANSEMLELPAGFIKEGIDKVSVKSVSKKESWIVQIYRPAKASVFLGGGWEKFVAKHAIGEDDVVLLRYNGRLRFWVSIFPKTYTGKVFSLRDGSNENDNLEAVGGLIRPKVEEEDVVEITSKKKRFCVGESSRGRRLKGSKIAEEKTKSFSSPNPWFWRLLTDYNVDRGYILNLPKASLRNMLKYKGEQELTLVNKDGTIWDTMVKVYGGQSFIQQCGWKSFAMHNSLKAGDVCVFERVTAHEAAELVIWKVHVFTK